ncbi:11376_t:CDS:1, partial [Gigaspora margarita]
MNDILAYFSIYVSFSSGLLSFLFTVTTSLTGIIVGNLSLFLLQRTNSNAFIQASYRERISILLLGQQIKSSLWQGLSFELFYNFSMWFRHYEKLWPVIIMCFIGNILVTLTELTSESVLFPEKSYYTTQNNAPLLFDPVTGDTDTTLQERGTGLYSNQDYANFYKFLQS